MAFATLVQLRANVLAIGRGPLFVSRSEELAALTICHEVPVIGTYRELRRSVA
jgi:hypothetical protein